MWSDTFLALERAGWIRLAVWGAASVALGAVLLLLTRQTPRSTLSRYFAVQLAAWGSAIVVTALAALWSLSERDLAGAALVEQGSRVAFDGAIALAVVGGATALLGWAFRRSEALLGTGIALVMQGVAIATLQLVFLRAIATATSG